MFKAQGFNLLSHNSRLNSENLIWLDISHNSQPHSQFLLQLKHEDVGLRTKVTLRHFQVPGM